MSEAIRNFYIEKVNPDVVLVCSLFEGASDDCAVSIPLSSSVAHVVVLYDLIPLLNRERYLSQPNVKFWYMRKIESLARADLLLGISESASQEAISSGLCADSSVITISSAVDSTFFRPIDQEEKNTFLAEKFGLKKPFVMYTGGIDWRKNIDGLIRAFSLLPLNVRSSYQIALVCHADENAKRNLLGVMRQCGLSEADVVFTGYVSDFDLRDLYRQCSLFVFPSFHEGFGLPVLEAMLCGAPVIGSRASSIPEVIGRDDALFDPANEKDISQHILRGLTDEAWRKELLAHAQVQVENFSWELTASRALRAIEKAFEVKRSNCLDNSSWAQHTKSDKPKLAMVTPMQPVRSGIADYVGDLLPALSLHYDITAICDAPEGVEWNNHGVVPIRPVKWFVDHAFEFERIVYQFGNSEYHAHMFELLLKYPGVVVLHDFFLSGVLNWMQTTSYRAEAFVNALVRSHGRGARSYLEQNGFWATLEKFPCCSFVLERALGLIVHSDFVVKATKSFFGDSLTRKMHIVPLQRSLPIKVSRQEARKALGLSDDTFLVCSFGFMGPTKASLRLVQAWLKSHLATDKRFRLVMVGQNDTGEYGERLEAAISSSPLNGQIQITGFTEREVYENYLASADLGIQLRTQSRGETSAAVLDCLAFGIPLIINANGPLDEYSSSEVFKLTDDFDDDSLVTALEKLCANEQLRNSYSQAGIDRIKSRHDPAIVALRYREIVENAYLNMRKLTYWNLVQDISSIGGDSNDQIAAAKSLCANNLIA